MNKLTKIQVRSQVMIAKEKGTLIPMPCEVCGDDKSEAHHNDYSKPLDVTWLCHKHHMAWHKENNAVEYTNGKLTKCYICGELKAKCYSKQNKFGEVKYFPLCRLHKFDSFNFRGKSYWNY